MLFEGTTVSFLRAELLWYFYCVPDILNPSNGLDSGSTSSSPCPEAAEVPREAWGPGPASGRAKFHQSVGVSRGSGTYPEEAWPQDGPAEWDPGGQLWVQKHRFSKGETRPPWLLFLATHLDELGSFLKKRLMRQNF